MGEGVEESLIDVAMQKGRLSEAQAKEFWARKKEDGQYIAVSTLSNHAYLTHSNEYAGNMVNMPSLNICTYSYGFRFTTASLSLSLPHCHGVRTKGVLYKSYRQNKHWYALSVEVGCSWPLRFLGRDIRHHIRRTCAQEHGVCQRLGTGNLFASLLLSSLNHHIICC